MLKTEAIKLLGGTPTAAASAVGISSQAVSQWPSELPRRIEDRVLAALARKSEQTPTVEVKGRGKRSKDAGKARLTALAQGTLSPRRHGAAHG